MTSENKKYKREIKYNYYRLINTELMNFLKQEKKLTVKSSVNSLPPCSSGLPLAWSLCEVFFSHMKSCWEISFRSDDYEIAATKTWFSNWSDETALKTFYRWKVSWKLNLLFFLYLSHPKPLGVKFPPKTHCCDKCSA